MDGRVFHRIMLIMWFVKCGSDKSANGSCMYVNILEDISTMMDHVATVFVSQRFCMFKKMPSDWNRLAEDYSCAVTNIISSSATINRAFGCWSGFVSCVRRRHGTLGSFYVCFARHSVWPNARSSHTGHCLKQCGIRGRPFHYNYFKVDEIHFVMLDCRCSWFNSNNESRHNM